MAESFLSFPKIAFSTGFFIFCSVDGLTLQRTASRQDETFQILPSRNVAAMRWNGQLGFFFPSLLAVLS